MIIVRSRWAKGAAVLVLLIALSVAATWAGLHLGVGPSKPVGVTGTIEATQVDVSVKITGRILQRLVKEGDRVTRGQVLVRLDASELAADVRRLDAARSAQSTLRDLRRGARPRRSVRGPPSPAPRPRTPARRDHQRTEQLFGRT